MSGIKNKLWLLFKIIVWLFMFALLAAGTAFFYFGKTLPDHEMLSAYESPITSRLYAEDGELIDEYALQKRSFIELQYIPKHIQEAFLTAEDSNFYYHSGIDVSAIIRAVWQNVTRFKEGRNFIGASTITQQVVKNILLTKERTITRKIKEAILAVRISKTLSKERVLEIYLNEIYLGYRSYGIVAAALNYFNKPLDELSIAEAAFLAALPKAPTSLDPRKNYDGAISRRNWVIRRMYDEKKISRSEAELALSSPIKLIKRNSGNLVQAGSFGEFVRKEITDIYSEKKLTENGLVIHGTLNPNIQNISFKALRNGLHRYDQRHGYRGAIAKITPYNDNKENNINNSEEDNNLLFDYYLEELSKVSEPDYYIDKNWQLAVVTEILDEAANIIINDKKNGAITLKDLKWAKKPDAKYNEITEKYENILIDVEEISDVLEIGDVIYVEKKQKQENNYLLRQIPEINGAVVAMNPHNGAILAMVGGYNDSKTEFNRAVQAVRQPGSIIKPFIYLAALENNFMPNQIIIDDEVRMKKEDGTYWIPMNYSNRFYGPTPLRLGLEKSRNVVTVRLAEMVGLDKIADVVKRYGISDEPVSNYALVLGAEESNLLRITTAYAMIANGGKKITPYAVEKVQDKNGQTIFRKDNRLCENCNIDRELNEDQILIPELNDNREVLTDSKTAYQMTSFLEGVVQRGTAWRARNLPKPVAGKTGTTNDSYDTWFVGFSPDLVVGVWAGFDAPKSLGLNETGSSVAVPIFVDIMRESLKDFQSRPFKIPSGLKFVKIDRNTGKAPLPSTLKKDIIFEIFKEENYEKYIKNNSNLNNGEINYENVIY